MACELSFSLVINSHYKRDILIGKQFSTGLTIALVARKFSLKFYTTLESDTQIFAFQIYQLTN
jgi:hypothetical protein